MKTLLLLLLPLRLLAVNQAEADSYPQYIYPLGTAVTAESDYAFWQQGTDSGIYHGQLSLAPGTLAFHSQPYYKTDGSLPVEACLSSQATATKKKLYYNISTGFFKNAMNSSCTFTAFF